MFPRGKMFMQRGLFRGIGAVAPLAFSAAWAQTYCAPFDTKVRNSGKILKPGSFLPLWF